MKLETAGTSSRLRTLICTPFALHDPKGNSVAARRLQTGLTRLGALVEVLDYPAVENPELIRQMTQRFQPDVILLLHAWRCATVAGILRTLSRAPHVTSLRGTDLNEMLDDPATSGAIESVLETSAVIVVFRRVAAKRLAACKRAWAAKTVIIPNGVQLPVSNVRYRQQLGIAQDAFVFGAVCGLREVKRPLLVLPWISRLREQYHHLAWMHTGLPVENDVTETLRVFASKHSWVYHTNQIPHSEMDSFLRSADVFVAASRSEGMPHAVREAMLAGRPCLLSDIEGHRALAEANREALFFSNQTEFEEAVHALINKPELRASLGEAAQARIRRDLAESDEAQLYLQLFLALKAGRNIREIAEEFISIQVPVEK